MPDIDAAEIGAPERTGRRTRPGSGRRRHVLPVVAALVVMSVVGGAASAARGLRGDGEAQAGARPLHLAGGVAGAGVRDAAPAGSAGSAGAPVRTVRLPDGPRKARVHPLDRVLVDESDVARLARTLGQAGTPIHTGRAWRVGSGARQLVVREEPGTPWSLGAPDCAVADVGPTVDCAAGAAEPGQVSGGSTGSAGAAVPGRSRVRCLRAPCPYAGPVPRKSWVHASAADRAAVRRAADRVLATLGLRGARVRVLDERTATSVLADPVVDGRRTVGFTSTLTYQPGAHLVTGNGWLGRPRTGAAYPLISADTAFGQLLVGPPRMLGTTTAEMPCDAVARGAPPCGARPRVTGAELGLRLSGTTRGGLLLVPAWLFAVEGSGDPLTVVAVESRLAYDKPGNPPTDLPSTEPTGVPRPTRQPVRSHRQLPAPSASVPLDALRVETDPASREMTVVAWGSPPECSDFRVTAAETTTTVRLTRHDLPRKDVVCRAIATERRATVLLAAPLGDRRVLAAYGARVVVTPTAR